ncbi:hypothetical protein KCV07_g8699, partial [Aureobasidium melanogenum]
MLTQYSHLMAAAIVGSILYLIAVSIYRLYFHPLSKYPGPRTAALSDWYAAFLVGRGDLHLHIRQWHVQYGPIIRTGPNSLCFNTATSMHEIYGRQANVLKDKGYVAMSASRRTTNTMSAIEKDDVNFKRRVHTRFLSDQNLKSLEPRLLEKINKFLNLLNREHAADLTTKQPEVTWSSDVNVSELCNWLTFDVITDFCYGEGLGMLESDKNRWFFQAIRAMSWRGMMCVIQPKLYELRIDRFFLASAYRDIVKVGTWAMKRAKARVERGHDPEKPDLFQSMLESKDRKSAGSDSTSTAMSATFFYLAHHPGCRRRVVEELQTTFTDDSDISVGTKLESCKYLAACVNEAMRLVPSVPNVLPRYVQPGGTDVDGEFMPEGAVLGCSQYAINRNPTYFPEPDTYRPERWLDDEGEAIAPVDQARKAFAPFGTGPRTCVGWKLAWTETNLTLARTLFSYDIRMAPAAPCCSGRLAKTDCEYHLKGYAVAVVDGPYLQFRRKT